MPAGIRQTVLMNTPTRSAVGLAALGMLLVVAYAAWAAFQILVLNPLAAVPGMSVGDVHAAMTAAEQWTGPASVYAPLGVGVLLAVGMFLVVISTGTPAITTVAAYLALLVLGAPGYFWASFGVGMGLADTFNIGGGDHSPWSLPLYAVSLAALVGLAVIGASSLLRRPHSAAALA